MQFVMKCEEPALHQKNQAQIYYHYVAAILSLETIRGGGGWRGTVLYNLGEFGNALLKFVPLVFPSLSMYGFKK